MITELNDAFWDDLLNRIEWREIVPVVGPGAVTYGRGDDLLYPYLTQRLANELTPRLRFDQPPRDLQEIVHAQRRLEQPVGRIYRQLFNIVRDPDLRPGITLTALAAIEPFRLFLSTTFDPLLWRAVESAWPGGRPEERCGALSVKDASPDLARPFDELERPVVYQILGAAKSVRDFVVWDDDALHFLLQLDKQFAQLPRLNDALINRHLLVLGASAPDWLLRFFFHVVKRTSLTELASSELFVAETLRHTRRHRVNLYFDRLSEKVKLLPGDTLDFIRQLYTRWRARHPAPPGDPYLLNKAQREKHRAPGCIFVSYATPDLETARYVVSQLQKAGLLVWFAEEQLEPGVNWQETLREAVDERCGLFLSLISAATAQRLEGDNIFERNRAARRRDLFADNAVFYLPVRIDDGQPMIPPNEPRGTKTIQGVQKPGGHLDEDFIGYLREKQRDYCAARDLPLPPAPP